MYFELLGGACQDRKMKMISTARMGLNAGIGDRLRFGFSFGAMYTHLRGTEGLIRKSEFNHLMGLEAGYRL